MKLVVGLGNPGREYAFTRHNVGFRVAEGFARTHAIRLEPMPFGGTFGRGEARSESGGTADVAVLLPQRFMNRSGTVVVEALRYAPVDDPTEDVIVVFDDVDLPFGRLRIRPAGSSGGHRGVADVARHLGTEDFPRLRVGVGRPDGDVDTADHLLENFPESDDREVDRLLGDAVAALEAILFEGIVPAMNRFNRSDRMDGTSG